MIKTLGLAIITTLIMATQAWAGEVTVSGAWVRATAPGQDTAAVSLKITSKKDGKLVGVSSKASAKAELHTMKMENDMMMMRRVQSIALPAMQEVSFGEGDHIMLIGLKKPLKEGDTVTLGLTVEFADKTKENIDIKADVKPLGEDNSMKDMPGMH